MQRWKIITPFALASVVAIAFFSGGPRVPMDDDNTSATQPVEVPKAVSSDKAQDILAMIRARQNKS